VLANATTHMPHAHRGSYASRGWARVRPTAGPVGAMLIVALAAALIRPAAAGAEVPIVGPIVKAVGGGVHAVLHPAEAGLEALLKVLEAIFGGIEAKLVAGVIKGLLTIPRFDEGHVAQLEHTTVALSAGMLSAVLTLSILRYYLAGLTDSGSGGWEAMQGLIRVIGAVGFIIAWPSIFSELVQIPQAFNTALLGSASVQHSVATLFEGSLVLGGTAFALSSGLGLIFVVLIGFISASVFIALLWMKVLLSVMMMFLYVAMPLCVALWPVSEMSWLATSAMRSLFVALIVPCVWALLFSLSAAVNADVLTWAPSPSVIDTVIIRPLAGITLMLLCITIPRFLIRTAMIGPHGQPGGGGWKVWRTVTFGMFAARMAAGGGQTIAAAAVEGHQGAQRMIDALPSQVRPPSGPGEGSLGGRVIFGRSGFPKGGGSGGKPQGGGDQGGSGEGGAPGSGGEPPQTRESLRVAGIQSPAYDGAAVDAAGSDMYQRSRTAPSSARAVADAMGKLPPETQRGIADFHGADHQQLRNLLAHNVQSPSLSEGQREALWTIGSARNREVEQGIGTALGALNAQRPAAPTPAAGAPAGQQAPGQGATPAPTVPSTPQPSQGSVSPAMPAPGPQAGTPAAAPPPGPAAPPAAQHSPQPPSQPPVPASDPAPQAPPAPSEQPPRRPPEPEDPNPIVLE
jgi:hypothetical protein